MQLVVTLCHVNYLFVEQEVLQQPAMLILNQDTAQKGMKILSIQGLKAPTNISDGSEALLSSVLDLPQFNDDERSNSLSIIPFF